MAYVFLILFLAALVALVVGMVNPRLVLGKTSAKRSGVAVLYGLAAVVSLALVGVTAPNPKSAAPVAPSLAAAPAPAVDPEKLAEEARKRKESAERAMVETKAMKVCEDEFRSRAAHPSTVSFGFFDRHAAVTWQDDMVVYRAGPTLKNAMGLELRYVMVCGVKAGQLVAFDAREAR